MRTVGLIDAEVKRIQDLARRNCEEAHIAEDNLFIAVLKAIASGECVEPRACAAEALESLKVKFARHCA